MLSPLFGPSLNLCVGFTEIFLIRAYRHDVGERASQVKLIVSSALHAGLGEESRQIGKSLPQYLNSLEELSKK